MSVLNDSDVYIALVTRKLDSVYIIHVMETKFTVRCIDILD